MAFGDFDAEATAIKARFSSLTPPTGLRAIQWIGDPPDKVGATPGVVVMLDEGSFDTGNGTREGHHDWTIQFLYAPVDAAVPRAEVALRKWATVLLYVFQTAAQLGGIVDVVRLMSYSIGKFTYQQDYWGIELRVHVTTTESWLAVS
jgi:hypothetical protein